MTLDGFWQAADNNQQLAEQLAQMFIELAQQTCLQLEQAEQQADWAQIAQLIHRLKGSAAILGFEQAETELQILHQQALQQQPVELTSFYATVDLLTTPITQLLSTKVLHINNN